MALTDKPTVIVDGPYAGSYGPSPNVDGVRVRSLGPAHSALAECDSCSWSGEAFSRSTVPALTARAKRHVAATGHAVSILRTLAVSVEPDA